MYKKNNYYKNIYIYFNKYNNNNFIIFYYHKNCEHMCMSVYFH